jgi:hypothetical protein
MADPTNVHVDEVRGLVITYTAAMQFQRGIAQMRSRRARNAEVWSFAGSTKTRCYKFAGTGQDDLSK